MIKQVSLLAAVTALLSASVVPAPARADAVNGGKLARQWCANCHVVDAGTAAPRLLQGPPSFLTIKGHLDAEQMRAFLTHPHGAMPDLALTRAEIDDVIEYIETLP